MTDQSEVRTGQAATMVSRRKILSRSRDDLNIEAPPPEEEEDIWYNKDKLYKVSQTIILVNNWRNHEWH